MADYLKNIVSLLTLVLFLLGTVLTGFGIFRTNEMSEKHLDESLIIPSQVLNGLTVMFLLYLTSTSKFSPSYKLLIIILLVGGMILEIYLTSYADRKAESIAAYVFISLNFLVRAFFLIDLIQGEWISPITQSVKPVQRVVKDTVVKPIQDVVKEVMDVSPLKETTQAPPKIESSVNRDLRSKWDKLRDILQSKPEGLTRESKDDAWRNVILSAEKSGRTDIKEVLREAVEKLKDKDGNPIPLNSVDLVGGRKRS